MTATLSAAHSGGSTPASIRLTFSATTPPAGNRFAVVTAGGKIDRDNGDAKIASGRITIEAEITIPQLVTKAIEWVAARCHPDDANHSKGYRSASSATGDQLASSASGIAAVALNIGYQGRARASEGGAIVLCNHDDDGNLRHIRAAKVGDHDGIRPDVFYALNDDGEFVEWTEKQD